MHGPSPRRALSEGDSKLLLAAFGVPVSPGIVAKSADEAVSAARSLGYPVALKGHGEGLAHKTELGLVKLNVADEEELTRISEALFSGAPKEMDGLLVAPMLKGRREFVAGLFRDPVFGPVVMFGLGGVFAEALNDVVFRIAPVTRPEALSMLDEVRSTKLLGPFRGEAAADREALAACLVGLSRLGAERPDVLEVDINPLLVGPDGSACAVDALVVTGEPAPPPSTRPAVSTPDLARFFHPRSVAFVGASASFGKWGQRLPVNLIAGGFKGPIYLVNPRGGSMWGRHVYKSVGEIPEAVELAVVTVPASEVIGLLPGFAEKGIRHVLVITSGFGETGDEGKALERELVAEARARGILLFGPNTMGILNPHANLCLTGVHVNVIPGETALLSQSGNMGVQLLEFASTQGLGMRAFAGSGNEAMVSVEDFMEGFEVDELTRTVLLYVESVKDGRRFFESAARVGRKKPVIVLKGGRTEAGNRAAASHTGALASDFKVFDAACHQAGVVTVEKPIEMLDASAVFSSLPLPKGDRVAIMTLGGGWGVVTSDLCAEKGLVITPLDAEIMAKFDAILPPYWSRTNPVDLVGENDPELPHKALEVLGAWDGCDAIINLGFFGRSHLLQAVVDSTRKVDPSFTAEQAGFFRTMGEGVEEAYLRRVVSTMEKYGKPIVGVNLVSGGSTRTLYEVEGSKYRGVFFSSPERAVNALYHMTRYTRFLSRG